MPDRKTPVGRRLTRTRRLLAYAGPDAHDAWALQALEPLHGQFLPWTDFSMRPAAILGVLNDIAVNQRRRIVECGSGNSTVYIGRLLASLGSLDVQVHSLEHDARWADIIQAMLAREGLDALVSVVVAPLVDNWYQVHALPQLDDIDLLVVDGPPAYQRSLAAARAPALTYFGPALEKGATVFLDDADRKGERQVIAAWERESGLRFRLERGGYAVATR